jgi:hypothetical protein
LETVGQAEYLKLLNPEQVIASREKIAAKFLGTVFEIDFVTASHEMERLGPQKPDDFSIFASTVSEWLENSINEGTLEGLRATIQVDPANARVTAYLGRRLADQALEQGSNPEEARRARGEADFLTSRAVKLAPDSDEVVKVLKLKTN